MAAAHGEMVECDGRYSNGSQGTFRSFHTMVAQNLDDLFVACCRGCLERRAVVSALCIDDGALIE
jgi:hypothetical protein